VFLTALTERVHSDVAIPPGRNFFLLMLVFGITNVVVGANFGQLVYQVNVIEFRKRRLPDAHIIIKVALWIVLI